VPTTTLCITIPLLYPSIAPLYKLKNPLGLLPNEHTSLITHIETTIADNLGTQMIYTLVSEMKSHIEWIVRDRRETRARILDERLRSDHEAEVKKSQGTKVTLDSFNAWNKNVIGISDYDDAIVSC
jgi:RWD domain